MFDASKKAIRYVLSVQMTIICLLLMILLVVWGTIYESTDGLFAARERFFQSWLTGFAIPVPGIKLISLVLLLNLSGNLVRLFRKPLKHLGLLSIHLGVALLLSAIILSTQFTREYYLSLQEGETSASAYDYAAYEIALQKQSSSNPDDYLTSDSVSIHHLKAGKEILFPNSGVECAIESIQKMSNPDESENFPAYQITLILNEPGDLRSGKKIVLNSGDQPVALQCNRETISLSLRPVAIALPVTLRLVDFSKKFHPGTEMLKKVRSHISIQSDNLERDVYISMNKPLRYGSYTFYQASFSHQGSKDISTFSVVYNPHRLVPYIASLLIIGGFLFHFIILIMQKIPNRSGHPVTTSLLSRPGH